MVSFLAPSPTPWACLLLRLWHWFAGACDFISWSRRQPELSRSLQGWVTLPERRRVGSQAGSQTPGLGLGLLLRGSWPQEVGSSPAYGAIFHLEAWCVWKDDSLGWAAAKGVKEWFSCGPSFLSGGRGGDIGYLISRANFPMPKRTGSILGTRTPGFQAGPQLRAEEEVVSCLSLSSPLSHCLSRFPLPSLTSISGSPCSSTNL